MGIYMDEIGMAWIIDNENGIIWHNGDTEYYNSSPWSAPAAFGNEPFGNGAADTLSEVLQYTTDKTKKYYCFPN